MQCRHAAAGWDADVDSALPRRGKIPNPKHSIPKKAGKTTKISQGELSIPEVAEQ
jgi:hypothetical protein